MTQIQPEMMDTRPQILQIWVGGGGWRCAGHLEGTSGMRGQSHIQVGMRLGTSE